MEYNSLFYDVNGVRLHVIDEGAKDSPILIFLHGFPEFWYGWKNQIIYFKNKGFRVMVPDQRGYNLSSKPDKVKDYSTDTLVKDIVDLIKAVRTEKVFIVGHDWGAAIAWRLAMEYPELVLKLIIINVPHPSVMLKTLKSNFRQILKSWYIGFFQIPIIPEKGIASFNFKIFERMLLRSSNEGAFTIEDLKKYKSAWSQPNSLKSMINWYRAAVRYPSQIAHDKEIVKVPVLIIWGAKDLALIRQMAINSLQYCNDGVLHMDENATHWIHHEKIEEVNQRIFDFIKK